MNSKTKELIYKVVALCAADSAFWRHDGELNDIIAYRIVKEK